MATSKRAALVVAVCALVAAGCTTKADGQPTPTGNGSASGNSPSESAGPASPTVDVPQPPKDLSLDGLDPCALYTDSQRAQLDVDDVRTRDSDTEYFKGMKECVLANETKEPFLEYSALAVTNEGVEVWLTGKRNADAELTSVQDYPAARFKFKGVEDEGCDIAVGVAKGQYLWVSLVPTDTGMKQDELCQLAEQASEMALTTLKTLK